MWRRKSGSKVACYQGITLNQDWVIIRQMCSVAISQKVQMNLIYNMCPEITFLEFEKMNEYSKYREIIVRETSNEILPTFEIPV